MQSEATLLPMLNTHRAWGLCAASVLVLACVPAQAQAQTPTPTPTPAVAAPAVTVLPPLTITSTVVVPGLGLLLRDIPANVQVLKGAAMSEQHQTRFADALIDNAASVAMNAAQGNPYQLDLSFRGFLASPLLGTPQGLSVFQDGVRINEPFGDVVNWDLLPASAIERIELMPGSIPVFGLNTLGGALVLQTKQGRHHQGTDIEVEAGSFGRRRIGFENGGVSGAWDRFLTAQVANEGGWAQHSGSQVRQLFGKLGYQEGDNAFDLSLTAADNRLEGSQTLPQSFLDDRTQAYTYPDINLNQLGMLTLTARHAFEGDRMLKAHAYVRRYINSNTNSNVNTNYGAPDPVTGVVDTTQAFNERATISQVGQGVALQLNGPAAWVGLGHQWLMGSSLDIGRARFSQLSQAASFTAAREAVGSGNYLLNTDADTSQQNWGLYAMDTVALNPQWTLTASTRYNHAHVEIADRTGLTPDLGGKHTFQRLNSGLGLNFNPHERFTAYANYSEGMRAPTPMELTCADPNAPCKLPNNFLSDPPLKAVVARTLEVGARGNPGDWQWSAAAYRSELDNDIQFVSSGGASNAGYFQNVGRTQRLGIELGLSGRTTWFAHALDLVAKYSVVDATYRTGFVENSPSNPGADANGDIVVAPGSRMPSIPLQSIKLRVQTRWGASWLTGLTMNAYGGSWARGDEANRNPDSRTPGYAVFNFDARWQLASDAEAFVRVDNVFNRRYANFTILGSNVFAGPGRTFDPANAASEPFVGQGAPRGMWVGFKQSWR